MIADGFTVTVTVNTAPVVHVPEVGVTLYVAVSATAAVLFSVPFTVLWPDADAPPDRSACIAGVLHAYVVPVVIVPVGV